MKLEYTNFSSSIPFCSVWEYQEKSKYLHLGISSFRDINYSSIREIIRGWLALPNF